MGRPPGQRGAAPGKGSEWRVARDARGDGTIRSSAALRLSVGFGAHQFRRGAHRNGRTRSCRLQEDTRCGSGNRPSGAKFPAELSPRGRGAVPEHAQRCRRASLFSPRRAARAVYRLPGNHCAGRRGLGLRHGRVDECSRLGAGFAWDIGRNFAPRKRRLLRKRRRRLAPICTPAERPLRVVGGGELSVLAIRGGTPRFVRLPA